MESRFQLNVEDILNKQFHVDFKGYSAEEVDRFLDLVMKDYEEYGQLVKELGIRLHAYEDRIRELQDQLVQLEGRENHRELEQKSLQNERLQNVDIVKRISRLEEEVFRK